jgi:hypothetical protein
MADKCFKCRRPIGGETPPIICDFDDCKRKYHRSCLNIHHDFVVTIQKNPLVSFSCDICKYSSPRHLNDKILTLEDKLTKLCHKVNEFQSNIFQQFIKFASLPSTTCSNDSVKSNGICVVGNNCSADRLQVVCDYGRWVQIGKFATTTTEEEIINHLADELRLSRSLIKCVKLVKNNTNLSQLSYCKFKISIPDYRFNELFNESIWPSGVMVSPFTPRTLPCRL